MRKMAPKTSWTSTSIWSGPSWTLSRSRGWWGVLGIMSPLFWGGCVSSSPPVELLKSAPTLFYPSLRKFASPSWTLTKCWKWRWTLSPGFWAKRSSPTWMWVASRNLWGSCAEGFCGEFLTVNRKLFGFLLHFGFEAILNTVIIISRSLTKSFTRSLTTFILLCIFQWEQFFRFVFFSIFWLCSLLKVLNKLLTAGTNIYSGIFLLVKYSNFEAQYTNSLKNY